MFMLRGIVIFPRWKYAKFDDFDQFSEHNIVILLIGGSVWLWHNSGQTFNKFTIFLIINQKVVDDLTQRKI